MPTAVAAAPSPPAAIPVATTTHKKSAQIKFMNSENAKELKEKKNSEEVKKTDEKSFIDFSCSLIFYFKNSVVLLFFDQISV